MQVSRFFCHPCWKIREVGRATPVTLNLSKPVDFGVCLWVIPKPPPDFNVTPRYLLLAAEKSIF